MRLAGTRSFLALLFSVLILIACSPYAQTQTITGLSINSGAVGDAITVTGTGFGATQGSSVVRGGAVFQALSWSDTSIVCVVPELYYSQNIYVLVNGVSSNLVEFMRVPPEPAGVGFVQGNYFSILGSSTPSTVQTVTIPFPKSQKLGNLNVVLIGWSDNKFAIQSVTDSAGNAYAVAAPTTSLAKFGQHSIYFAKNIHPAGANSVTVKFTGAAHLPEIRIAEYKGIQTASPLDGSHGNSGTSSHYSISSGFVATTQSNDVLVGGDVISASMGAGSGTTVGVNLEALTTRGSILEDQISTSIGSYELTAPVSFQQGSWVMQIAAFKQLPNQAPVVDAGQNQTITLPNNVTALAGTVSDDGLPNNTLSVSWSQISGPGSVTFSDTTIASPQVTFPSSGTYVLQLTASDTQLSSSSTVTITVLSPISASLALSPTLAGPNVIGTSQTLTANLKTLAGIPISGATVQFAVTGSNTTSGSGTTDANGVATFTYSGTYGGVDTAQSSFGAVLSNTSTINWIVPAKNVSTSPVLGQFFTSDQSGVFNTLPSATPVFSQTFPTINFNPPSGSVSRQILIDGRCVPWRVTGSINAAYSVSGLNTGLNPVSVAVSQGQTISVSYVSGLWSVSNPIGSQYGYFGNAWGSWDANGVPNSTGPAVTTANAESLVGGFADATGQILSLGPFFIGNSFNATAPSGATQLLMGLNDGVQWSDNSGALVMNATVSNAPNPSGIGINTHPFTDVITDLNGNNVGTIVAQGNGFKAGGVGSLYAFQAVFRGTLTVGSAGDVPLYIFANDAFILGVGNGASRISGPMVGAPSSGTTAFEGLQVMGAYNAAEEQSNTVVVHFPSAGTYPYELDYADNGAGGQPVNPAQNHLSLTMSVTQTNNGQNVQVPLPPTASLALTPLIPTLRDAGQSQTFSVKATDASGQPVPNLTVRLIVLGANEQTLMASTDSTGTAQFSYSGVNAGADVIEASAEINGLGTLSNSVNVPWSVPTSAPPGTVIVLEQQGWIGQPTTGTIVQGQVPITVTSGVTLTSGTLKYWPSTNPSDVHVINSSVTGSGTLGTFDATSLPNGGYTIQLVATDSSGATQTSVIVVTVVGDSKPGRLTSTVTEFKVPLAGIPITISRTYDSLERSAVEDFGYGWKLGTNVGLSVDSKRNVTFNFNGQRFTFYFRPQPSSALFPWLLIPNYVPQPGFHGTLASDGCGSILNVQSQSLCFDGGTYSPTVYGYTDPSGRTYTISASGQLQSIKDLNGNVLTITPNGITSSVNGTVIPFLRDGSGRITKITDLNGKDYAYTYDADGNLQSAQRPGIAAATYTYSTDHSLLTENDPRGNSTSATYYPDGRLQTTTGPTVQDGNGNPVQYVTQYAYDLATNTTTVTNPDGGVITRKEDSFGKPLTITEKVDASTTRTTTYLYDATENLISVTDPLNHTTTYTYDSNGFQTSVQLPGLPANSITYNQYGGITSQTDAAATNIVSITYDADFNPALITDSLNGAGSFVSSFTYDSLGNVLASMDANHKTTTFTYFPQGYLKDKTDALQEKISYTYDPMGSIATVTDPRLKVTQNFYDDLERLTKVIDANNVTKQIVYDDNGNKTDEIEAVGTSLQRTTHFDYDALNRLIKTTYPDLTTKQFFYDFRGNKLTEIDQLGRTTKYSYDLAGQLTGVTYAYGTTDAGTVGYSYYLDGKKQTVTDERGNGTTNFYDPAGRLTSVKDALQNSTTFGYDDDNRRTSATNANNSKMSFSYDARGRVKTVTFPTSPVTTTKFTFDGMGRTLTVTDPAGKVTAESYDDVGRLSSLTDAIQPTGNVTSYTYDANGNLKTIKDALQRITSFDYDNLNRRSKKTLPLLQFESYNYDFLGRLQTKTDFNGKTTTYNYDALDRVLSKVPDASTGQPTISFTYFATGTRHTMSDSSGSTTYTYDNRDRVLSKATPEGTLSYTYDAHGNVLSINSSNANGASMAYTYDALNRLWTAQDNRVASQGGPATPTTYSYDPAGNLSGYTYPNALVTSNIFDPLNRLTQTCTAATSPACSAGTKLSSYTYTLGPSGNRASVLELGGRNVAYGYDEDYRLKSETISADPNSNNGAVNYVYDLVGNRTSMTSTLGAVPGGQFSYDNNDRLATDVFDSNGNTTSSAGIVNTYDFENRMRSHGAVVIIYDGDGNRVSETAGGNTTKYLVDGVNPTRLVQVFDEVASGAVTRTYAYGLQRISENQQIGGVWTPAFYGYDGHGNVRFLTNVVGATTDSYDYDAFGSPVKTNGTTPNSYYFGGELSDGSVGLYYLRARYYNQATGRFWVRDPLEKAPCCNTNRNTYVYAASNPVNMVDPSGLAEFEEETGSLEEVFEDVQESTSKLKSLMKYRLQQVKTTVDESVERGYEISTDKTEDIVDEMLDQFIKMWNNR